MNKTFYKNSIIQFCKNDETYNAIRRFVTGNKTAKRIYNIFRKNYGIKV